MRRSDTGDLTRPSGDALTLPTLFLDSIYIQRVYSTLTVFSLRLCACSCWNTFDNNLSPAVIELLLAIHDSLSCDLGKPEAGSHSIKVEADPENLIEESNESNKSNNHKKVSITVVSGGSGMHTDLVISSIPKSPRKSRS